MKNFEYELLTAPALNSFLNSYGWEVIKTFGNGVQVWKTNEGRKKLWIPTDNTFDDFEDAIEEVIQVLASEENISEEEAILRLKQAYITKDLLQIRVDASDIKSGNISFNDGVNVFNSLKNIVLGAIKELSGSHAGLKTKYFLETDLGQTAQGSYIVNAYLPLLDEPESDLDQLQLENLEGETIGRQVNKTLINRLVILKKILNDYSDNNSNALIQQLLTIGYTKQECDAVAKLFGEVGNRDWQVKVLWSHSQESAPQQVSLVEFSNRDATKIRKISDKLKSTDIKEGVSIAARVVGLKRDHALNETTGTVSLKFMIGDVEKTLTSEMDEQAYTIANEAHKSKKYVQVEGNLMKAKIGRSVRFFMPKVTNVDIIEKDLELNETNSQLTLRARDVESDD